MNKEKILSNAGFLFGMAGIIITPSPLDNRGRLYNTIIPVLLGIIGLIFILKVRKILNDDITKAGLVVNSISIIFGIIQLFN